MRPLHASPVDGLIAFVALLGIDALVYMIMVSPDSLSLWEMRSFAGAIVTHVLVVAVVAIALRRSAQLGQVLTGLLWAMILGLVLALAVSFFASSNTLIGWVLTYAVPSLVPAVLYLLTALGLVGGLAAGVGLVTSVLVIVLEWAGAAYWDTPVDDVPSRELADTEAVYSAQDGLLEAQVSNLRRGDPDQVELFAVLGAGYPYEQVFQREVEAVGELLEQEFAARDRVIRLVNSVSSPEAYPLLNRTNLSAAIRAVGAAMDPDDLFLLFLTSHGGDDLLATEFAGVMTRNLSAESVRTALDASGIQNAILVVSACYSGSFVPELQAPQRLILTAAAADASSFGCSDKAEWTNWGRAFFVEGLAETRDFREAARIAQDLVADWEDDEGFPPSDPMIVEGDQIGPAIDRWLETFGR